MSTTSNTGATADLLIRQARVIDPSQGIDQIADLAVHGGKITGIGDYDASHAKETIDATDLIVSPGWIDLHAHVFSTSHTNSLDPDGVAGIERGVTTVVDAGTAGADDWESFVDTAIVPSTTRVLGYLNVSTNRPAGPRHGEWRNFSQARTITLAERATAAGNCLGIKVLASQTHCGNMGITPVKLARQAARLANTGLMVHIGNAPPVIEDVLALLGEGDIVTHCWHGKYGGLLDHEQRPLPATQAAVERGVKFDLGHGSASFAFATAHHALEAGLPLHAISTDLHRGCVDSPVHDMATTMSKCLHLGLSLADVIRLSTASPAALMGRAETLGSLAAGREADLTIFRVATGNFTLTDSEGERVEASQRIEPLYTVRAGQIVQRPDATTAQAVTDNG